MTFRFKHELDPEGILQSSPVAEQVEKVNPDLVWRVRTRVSLTPDALAVYFGIVRQQISSLLPSGSSKKKA